MTSPQRWETSINDTTGTITTNVPKDTVSGANFEVKVVFADGSERQTTTFVRNTGKGVELPPAPAPNPEPSQPAPDPSPEPAGSSTAQKLGLVFGVLSLLVGAVAVAWPQLQQFLPQM